MSDTTHTPLPWADLHGFTRGKIEIRTAKPIYAGAERGKLVASVHLSGNPEARHDAALIVRAVNNHARLVEFANRVKDAFLFQGSAGDILARFSEDARALLAELEA